MYIMQRTSEFWPSFIYYFLYYSIDDDIDNLNFHALAQKNRNNDNYRLGPVNSKSFAGQVLLWIKWKFELQNNL